MERLLVAVVVWSDVLLPGVLPVSIMAAPTLTLSVATALALGVQLAMHALGWRRAPRGLAFAGRNAALTTVLLYAVALLFGAPLVSGAALAWAALVGALYAFGERDDLRALPTVQAMLWSVTPLSVALVYSWLGCMVIPLDWDRPYQPFPVGSALLMSALAHPTVLALRMAGFGVGAAAATVD